MSGHPVVRTAAGQCWRAKLVIGADGAARLRNWQSSRCVAGRTGRRPLYRPSPSTQTMRHLLAGVPPHGPLALLPLAYQDAQLSGRWMNRSVTTGQRVMMRPSSMDLMPLWRTRVCVLQRPFQSRISSPSMPPTITSSHGSRLLMQPIFT